MLRLRTATSGWDSQGGVWKRRKWSGEGEFSVLTRCFACSGQGRDFDDGGLDCTECDGTGQRRYTPIYLRG
jgi:DnaJ-class molecular chaperone